MVQGTLATMKIGMLVCHDSYSFTCLLTCLCAARLILPGIGLFMEFDCMLTIWARLHFDTIEHHLAGVE